MEHPELPPLPGLRTRLEATNTLDARTQILWDNAEIILQYKYNHTAKQLAEQLRLPEPYLSHVLPFLRMK